MGKKKVSLIKPFSNERKTLLEKIYECIRITLGPTGKNGIVSVQKQALKVLTNGSFFVKHLEFSDFSANIVLKLLEQASLKTSQISGDGSTTTLLFTCEFLSASFRFLANGYNSVFLSNGFKKLAYFLNQKVLESSFPIRTKNQLKGILSTAAGKKIRKIVFSHVEQSMDEIERDGLLIVEENISSDTEVEIVQGIELDKGFASSYFINDFKNFEVKYENPYILITKSEIQSLNQLSEVIEYIQTQKRPLVIITEEISKEILSTLVLNNIQKKFQVVVIKYKSIQFIKNGMLEDLSLLTHSNYLFSNIKTSNVFFTVEDLGQAEKVIIKKEKSTFFVSKFAKLVAKRRMNELNRDLLTSESEYEKSLFKNRIARLSGNITKLKLGFSNPYEMDELKQKIENLVMTVKSSLEEGFVPGGGVFYFFLGDEIRNWAYVNLIGEEFFAGQILSQSFKRPFYELFENANTSPYPMFQKISNLGYPFAYDLCKNKFVHCCDEGLVDAAKSVRASLWNSITTTSLFITSE